MNKRRLMLHPRYIHRNKPRRELAAKKDSSRSRISRLPLAQNIGKTVNASREDPLCGWELSQLCLLHDDSGIVEWFADKEHQIFSDENKTGWGSSLFDRVPLSDNKIKTTNRDLTETRALNKLQQSSLQKRSDFSNLILKDVDVKLLTDKRKCKRENEEIKFFSGKSCINNVNSDLDGSQGYNTERKFTERDLKLPSDTRCCEQITRVSKLHNLERKLATRRALKIVRGVECIRQPLTKNTTGGTLKKELFNPSVVSLMCDNVKDPALPLDNRYEKRGTKRTLCKQFLQLLPIDKAVKSAVDFTHAMKPRPTLPKLVPKITCEQLNLSSKLNSGVLFQRKVQKNLSKSNKASAEFVVLRQMRQPPL